MQTILRKGRHKNIAETKVCKVKLCISNRKKLRKHFLSKNFEF